ncbi:hypothetical protein AAG570_007149 [Ranatra chinensis]|uniref:Uncharacterized protein n=1 Tax=Ranatra chinensis TaxID=642074 RepID=A0ABD0XVC2_9HEMI
MTSASRSPRGVVPLLPTGPLEDGKDTRAVPEVEPRGSEPLGPRPTRGQQSSYATGVQAIRHRQRVAPVFAKPTASKFSLSPTPFPPPPGCEARLSKREDRRIRKDFLRQTEEETTPKTATILMLDRRLDYNIAVENFATNVHAGQLLQT